MVLLVRRGPLGGKGLAEPICPSLFLNPFPPRPTPFNYTLLLHQIFLLESHWVEKGYNIYIYIIPV